MDQFVSPKSTPGSTAAAVARGITQSRIRSQRAYNRMRDLVTDFNKLVLHDATLTPPQVVAAMGKGAQAHLDFISRVSGFLSALGAVHAVEMLPGWTVVNAADGSATLTPKQ